MLESFDPRWRAKHGCVIRALQSITGASATDAEWEARYQVMKKTRKDFKIVPERAALARELEYIVEMTEQFASSGSPMGLKLAEQIVSADYGSLSYFQRLVGLRSHLMVRTFPISPDGKMGNHFFHLGLDENQQPRSLSDGSPQPVRLSGYFDCIIFAPR